MTRYSADPKHLPCLATIDFKALGIIYPRDIGNLVFTEEGVPLSVIAGAAPRWDDNIKGAIELNVNKLLPDFRESLERLSHSSSRIRASASNSATTPAQVLADSEELLRSALAAQKAVKRLNVISDKQVAEIQRHIEGLRVTLLET